MTFQQSQCAKGQADWKHSPLPAHLPYLIKLIISSLPEEMKLFSAPESSLFLDVQSEVMNNVYNPFEHISQLKCIPQFDQAKSLSIWPRNLYQKEINQEKKIFYFCRRQTSSYRLLLTRKHGLRDKLPPESSCCSCCSCENMIWNMKC